MDKKHLKFFSLARRLAQKSTHPRQKLGCIIVNGKTIVGFGYNQLKSHPRSPTKWKTIHAEFHAILGVSPSELIGSTAYVYRETVNGKIGLAKPCSCCQKMLSDCGVRNIFYTTDEGGYKI
jgi:deoxycytidylate deaminase